jgi:nucleolar protein 9
VTISDLMPRENRKRGKKHKKEPEHEPEPRSAHEQAKDGPSWIVRREDHSVDSNQIHTDEAPFGYVDADVKAYFRTVDIQIRDWQDTKPHVVESDDLDPNEGECTCLALH